MFIAFSHVAEDDRCLIDFNFLSVDDDPCFHRFSQNALWIQHVGCFAQERLVSVMLLIQLAWHTLTTLKLHSGKLTYCGKSPILMGKSTISMVIFNSYVSLPEGIYLKPKETMFAILLIWSHGLLYPGIASREH